MSFISNPVMALPARPGGVSLARRLARASRVIFVWRDRARERHDLAGLNDRLLRDIGLSRMAAWREAQKPFWRA